MASLSPTQYSLDQQNPLRPYFLVQLPPELPGRSHWLRLQRLPFSSSLAPPGSPYIWSFESTNSGQSSWRMEGCVLAVPATEPIGRRSGGVMRRRGTKVTKGKASWKKIRLGNSVVESWTCSAANLRYSHVYEGLLASTCFCLSKQDRLSKTFVRRGRCVAATGTCWSLLVRLISQYTSSYIHIIYFIYQLLHYCMRFGWTPDQLIVSDNSTQY